jgi:hypothetical protein
MAWRDGHGDTGMDTWSWRHGNMETRRNRDTETLRHGTRTHGAIWT